MDTQAREQLERLERVLPEVGDAFQRVVDAQTDGPKERYTAFIGVLRRDAEAGLAAVQLVLAQAGITSQMVRLRSDRGERAW